MDRERILGIDPGRRRVGLALSDAAEGTIAIPLANVRGGSPEESAKSVREYLHSLDPAVMPIAIVVGLPLRLDGSEGASARMARAIGEAIRESLDCNLVFWDERMTSAQASRDLRRAGVNARAQRGQLDERAAAILLQSFLDAHRERPFPWDLGA